jgi:hypothetical protein
MKKSKLNLLVLGVAGLFAVWFWMLSSHQANTDEAHRRSLRRYSDLYFRMNALEHRLGGDVATMLGVQALERRYEHKADGEREALLASGYFVTVSATVTNLNSRTEEVNERFRHIDGDPEGLTIFSTKSNQVTVICRPRYAAGYREELRKR